ncbi:DUF5788 family protein [Halorhabdus sp. CUG00001]|uniref:DUF5788 family protein n=1 Tax=Halorhabdus sp. CUG00001 TaxID=2600297 RepID=UPI00131D37D6|nr:DUF5788 family protein [Halorhabdus sp. CUG00001]
MHDYERKQLLERIEREGATVGTEIPETIDIDGEPLSLHAFVFETRQQESIPPAHRERVEDVKTTLRRERGARKERLESADLSRETGEGLAESIVGIDRALNALNDLGSADLEQERAAAETADQKRWVRFLKQALGQDDTDDRRAQGGVEP